MTERPHPRPLADLNADDIGTIDVAAPSIKDGRPGDLDVHVRSALQNVVQRGSTGVPTMQEVEERIGGLLDLPLERFLDYERAILERYWFAVAEIAERMRSGLYWLTPAPPWLHLAEMGGNPMAWTAYLEQGPVGKRFLTSVVRSGDPSTSRLSAVIGLGPLVRITLAISRASATPQPLSAAIADAAIESERLAHLNIALISGTGGLTGLLLDAIAVVEGWR